jgi:hypothetical protein
MEIITRRQFRATLYWSCDLYPSAHPTKRSSPKARLDDQRLPSTPTPFHSLSLSTAVPPCRALQPHRPRIASGPLSKIQSPISKIQNPTPLLTSRRPRPPANKCIFRNSRPCFPLLHPQKPQEREKRREETPRKDRSRT